MNEKDKKSLLIGIILLVVGFSLVFIGFFKHKSLYNDFSGYAILFGIGALKSIYNYSISASNRIKKKEEKVRIIKDDERAIMIRDKACRISYIICCFLLVGMYILFKVLNVERIVLIVVGILIFVQVFLGDIVAGIIRNKL